jgi:hypothetical protein
MFEVRKRHSATRFPAGHTRFFSVSKIQTAHSNSIKSSRVDSRVRWITSKKIPDAGSNLIIRNLMTKTEPESENCMELNHLKQLPIPEYFIEFCRRKNFKTQNKQQKHLGLAEVIRHTASKLRSQVLRYQQHCDFETRNVIETVRRSAISTTVSSVECYYEALRKCGLYNPQRN